MTTWLDLPGLLPLHRSSNETSPQQRDASLRMRKDDAVVMAQQLHQADILLLSVVLIFLVGSYLVCRYGRCKRRGASARQGETHSYSYTTYRSSSCTGAPEKIDLKTVLATPSPPTTQNVTTTNKNQKYKNNKKKKATSVLVSEMEEPFLGPPDYEQPPPYEMSPPAYEYLPSAPPLSDDSNHSHRQL